jgi:septum formation protein
VSAPRPPEAEARARASLVLASASPRRLALLQQIGIEPAALLPAEIDETPKRNEAPRTLAGRLAAEKADKVFGLLKHRPDLAGSYVLAADTVVCVGRRVLPKCETTEEAESCLRLLSGRAHRVFTGVTLVTPRDKRRHKMVETRVRFKRLSAREIGAYLASNEWENKAGGYAVQGLAAAFVVRMIGSYTSVVGLPLHETMGLLVGEGWDVTSGWGATA